MCKCAVCLPYIFDKKFPMDRSFKCRIRSARSSLPLYGVILYKYLSIMRKLIPINSFWFSLIFIYRSWGSIDFVYWRIGCWQNGEYEESYSVFGLCSCIETKRIRCCELNQVKYDGFLLNRLCTKYILIEDSINVLFWSGHWVLDCIGRCVSED